MIPPEYFDNTALVIREASQHAPEALYVLISAGVLKRLLWADGELRKAPEELRKIEAKVEQQVSIELERQTESRAVRIYFQGFNDFS